MKSPAAIHTDAPRLAVLVYNLAATGVTLNALRIAEHAARNGFTTQLWLWQKSGPFADRIPEGVEIIEFGIQSSSFSFGFLRRLGILLRVSSLANLITARKPDILLSAGNRCHIAASLAWKLSGRPHETAMVARASNAISGMGRHNWTSHLRAWLDSAKYAGFHHVIAVSQELATKLAAARPGLQSRIQVIPNGVDLERIKAHSADKPDHKFFKMPGKVLVSAGTITKQKNFPLLVDALALLRDKMPEANAKLIIIGDASEEARSKLAKKIELMGLSEYVDLAGYVRNPASYFTHADVYVLSSLWEGASNSLLEALACGTRIAATDCPTGIRELLNEGAEGSIAQLGNARALADAIASELSKPVPGRSRAQWMTQYSLKHCLDSYISFFRQIHPGLRGNQPLHEDA